jgi:hypothetical protein
MPSELQKKRSKNTTMMIDEREWLLPSSKVVGDDSWQKKKELQRLQKKATTLSIIPVNDLRMIHLEERWNDMIQATKKQSDSDSDVKCVTVQFHNNNHRSQFDRWIELKFNMGSPDMFSYLGLNFQIS